MEISHYLGTIIDIIIAVIGFGGVLLSLAKDRKIKVAEFISKYNETFISNPQFIEIERKLGGCNDFYTNCCNDGEFYDDKKAEFESYCDRVFGTLGLKCTNVSELRKYDVNGALSEDYQKIVNYLVYLESFSSLIVQNQVRLSEVDDLFGYRFFIAVNNPVIQNLELCPQYLDFYKGICKAYKKWDEYYQENKLVQPLKYYKLI